MEGQIDAFAQLHLQFVDRTQWRYEVIRPVVLLADRTPQQRARETQTHPATVRKLTGSVANFNFGGKIRREYCLSSSILAYSPMV
jgi:hypothetical protein